MNLHDSADVICAVDDFGVRHPAAAVGLDHGVDAGGVERAYRQLRFLVVVEGMDRDEGSRLLAFLYQQASLPEYQVRFRWRKDSIAFWDNRSTQHYASSDYWPETRVMERVTVAGDRPY